MSGDPQQIKSRKQPAQQPIIAEQDEISESVDLTDALRQKSSGRILRCAIPPSFSLALTYFVYIH